MEKSYLINSKINVPRTLSNNKKLKLLKYIIIGSAVLIIIGFLLNDLKVSSLRPLILPLAFYFYYKNRAEDKEGTIFTTVEAILNSTELVLIYSKIDKRDGMGSRREVITFPYKKILGFEYNENLLCLRIAGKPSIHVQYEDQKKFPGIQLDTNGEEIRIHLLYLDAANANEFLQTLGVFTNSKIEHKEYFSSVMSD